jgi:hypothetical protein
MQVSKKILKNLSPIINWNGDVENFMEKKLEKSWRKWDVYP